MHRERVCVIGLGYVGLPTASLLATQGFEVRGVDIDPRRVDAINSGQVAATEAELDVLVRSAVQSGHLEASLQPAPADVFIIAVPTPCTLQHRPDLSFVESAFEGISSFVQPSNLVILESTVPVGTTGRMCSWLAQQRPDLSWPSETRRIVAHRSAQVYVSHCPERVLPGRILEELLNNHRVVGGVDGPSTARAHEFFRSFVRGQIIPTDARTAEMAKLAENAFRDSSIAFANELSLICERLEVDVWDLIEIANHHPRVKILRPGAGVGGHCIPVDPWFIIDSAPEEALLLRAARETNQRKTMHVTQMAIGRAERLDRPIVACLGLAYKNDVDDLRESPAVEVVRGLVQSGAATVWVVEPHIQRLPEDLAGRGVELVALERALSGSDLIVVLVRHRQFLALDRDLLRKKDVIDTCGLLR